MSKVFLNKKVHSTLSLNLKQMGTYNQVHLCYSQKYLLVNRWQSLFLYINTYIVIDPVRPKEIPSDLSIKLILLTDNFKFSRYLTLTTNDVPECSDNNLQVLPLKCLNVTAMDNKNPNYIILFKEEQKHSWIDASLICSKINGTLPYFISEKQQDDLIAMVKLSMPKRPKSIHYVEAIYIGLSSKGEVKLLQIYAFSILYFI